MIVALEGVDGCGKSTQARKLAAHYDWRLFAFPCGQDPLGAPIRAWLAHAWRAGVAEPHVFQALQVVNRIAMLPSILEARNAVLDRWLPSGFVYGALDGVSFDWLVNVQAPLPHADLNILLDVPPEVAIERVNARESKREVYENGERIRKTVGGYRDFWCRHEGRAWAHVDATQSEDAVFASILLAINRWITP